MLLADECWLVARDDMTGRPLLPSHMLGIAVASGLLAELLHARILTLRPDGPVVSAMSPPRDPVQRATAERMARERHSVESWLRFLARDSEAAVGGRLVAAGVMEERHTRSMLGKRKVEYFSRGLADASWPRIRLAKILTRNQPVEGHDLLLAGWIDTTGMTRHVLWDDTDNVGKRYLEHLVAYLPAELRSLYSTTNKLMNQLMLR